MNARELALEQIRSLPDEDLREVLDFIGYLKQKEDRAQWSDLMRAQQSALDAVWNNDQDEVWNGM